MNKVTLKAKIVRSLRKQGFQIRGNKLIHPPNLDKERIRQLHALAVSHQVEKCREGLVRYEDQLMTRIACGSDVKPENTTPRLIEVQAQSEDELLFRYIRLHWSISGIS